MSVRVSEHIILGDQQEAKTVTITVDGKPLQAREEVVQGALELVNENENVGAILLECSDMPPYAADIQAATQLSDPSCLFEFFCGNSENSCYNVECIFK